MIERHNTNADTVIVVDFETTGMSPDHDDRAIEVGAVKLDRGEIVGTLVAFNHLPSDGTFHRALADAEMTAHLWLGMLKDIRREYRIESISFSLMQALSRVSKAAAPGFLRRWTGPPS